MIFKRGIWIGLLTLVAAAMVISTPVIAQQTQRPNIVFIMADDIGWANISAYHRGLMASRTPNLDQLASQGMMFTDYYAEASCTAGRANFITGEIPFRTGLTTVGQAGSPQGMPDEAPTIATVLKSMGYATGQFGKNHLGDLNRFLPTCTGSTSFMGISITSTRWKIPATSITRRNSKRRWDRVTWFTATRPMWTIPRCSPAGAKSESKRSKTRENSVQNGWRRLMTKFWQTPSSSLTRPDRITSPSFSGLIQLACMS